MLINKWFVSVVFVVFIALQTISLWPRVNDSGLWSDELFTAALVEYHDILPLGNFERKMVTQIDLHDSFLTVKAGEQHPPLYDLLLKGWASVFDSKDSTLRFFSLFCFGLSSLVWVVMAHLFPERRYQFLFVASMMLLLKYNQVYALQARSYSFSELLSSLLFCGWYVDKVRGASKGLYLSIAACFVTHYYLAVFAGVIYLWRTVPLVLKRKWVNFWVLLPVILSLTWIFVSVHSLLFTAGGGVSWMRISILGSIMSVYKYFYLYFGPVVFLAGASIVATTLFRMATDYLSDPLVFIVSSSVLLGLVVHLSGIQHPRHFLFYIPWLLFVFAESLKYIFNRFSIYALVVSAILTVALMPAPENVMPDEQYNKASRFLLDTYPQGKKIVATWRPNEAYYKFYIDQYDPDNKIDFKMISSIEEMKSSCPEVVAEHLPIFAHSTHSDLIDAYKGCLLDLSVIKEHHFGSLTVIIPIK